jgi:hypothetical protein
LEAMMTVEVAGQVEVCQLARILVEHRTPFAIQAVPDPDPHGRYGLYVFELRIPSNLALSTYDFALADRPFAED